MKRRKLPLSSLDADGSPIAAALSMWRAARPRNGRLPARAGFDLGRLEALLDESGWVGVTGETAARFRFHVAAAARPRRAGDLETIARHGGALRQAARPVYDDYAAAAFTGVPLFHHLLSSEGGAVERLILPFADDGVGVDGLLVCSRSRASAPLH